MSGSCNIRQFNQQFDVDLDPEEYDNLAEYLLSLQSCARKGESHVLEDGLQILVMESDNKASKRWTCTCLRNKKMKTRSKLTLLLLLLALLGGSLQAATMDYKVKALGLKWFPEDKQRAKEPVHLR